MTMWSPYDADFEGEASSSNHDHEPAQPGHLLPPPGDEDEDQAATTNTSSLLRGLCAVCGVTAKVKCSSCEKSYCSRKHQQTDWGKHRRTCRPFCLPSQNGTGRGSNGNSNTSSGGRGLDHTDPSKWMMSTTEMGGGNTLFSERPLVVTPNVLEDNKLHYCFNCLCCFSNPDRLAPCLRCLLPLCQKCQASKHESQDCLDVAASTTKNRGAMMERNMDLGRNQGLLKDFSIFKVLQLAVTNPTKFASFLTLKTNLRYQACLKDPTDSVKAWGEIGTGQYPMSEGFLQAVPAKVGSVEVKLDEVIRIFVLFSDPAPHSSKLRVLYEFKSWIPQACTPNVEFHFHPEDPQLRIYTQTVELLKADGPVYANYLAPSYKEGVSKSEVRLWNAAKLVCVDKTCSCKSGGRVDASVGIKCGQVRGATGSFGNCLGHLAPLLDPPNTEKPSLGILIYVKSKAWVCSRCKRSEKYSEVMKSLKEVGDRMKALVEVFCKAPHYSKTHAIFQQLSAHLGDNHWLWVRFNQAAIKAYSQVVGEGKEMLGRLVPLAPHSSERNNFLRIVKMKVDLYGDHAWKSSSVSCKGLLPLLTKRHGRGSFLRGEFALDAFYANLIHFAEQYKGKLGPESANEILGKWRMLMRLAEDAVQSFRQPIPVKKETQEKLKLATQLQLILQSAVMQCHRNKEVKVPELMRGFMKRYAVADPTFRPGPEGGKERDLVSLTFDPFGAPVGNLAFGPAFGSRPSAAGDFGSSNFFFKNGSGSSSNFHSSRKEDKDSFHSSSFTFDVRDDLADELGASDSDSSDSSFLETFEELLTDTMTHSVNMRNYQALLNAQVKRMMHAEKLLQDLLNERD